MKAARVIGTSRRVTTQGSQLSEETLQPNSYYTTSLRSGRLFLLESKTRHRTEPQPRNPKHGAAISRRSNAAGLPQTLRNPQPKTARSLRRGPLRVRSGLGVRECPPDSAHPGRPDSGHAYRSSWYEDPDAPIAPAP